MQAGADSLAVLLCGILLSSLGLASCAVPSEPPPEGTPRLVLLVVVDQMRYDYLERLDPLLTGGLRRLLDEGLSFTDAHHDHATTNTAPGHATLLTGLHPGHSGIVSNSWVDRDTGEWVYCVGDERYETSPAQMLHPALGDWLQDRYPDARVISIGGKDRSAVLMGGWDPDGAFWYDRATGGMATSDYYRQPDWVEDFNERDLAGEWFGRLWQPLPVDEEAALAAGFEDFDEGPFGRWFPHATGRASLAADGGFYGAFYVTPFLDQVVGAFARRALDEEELGRDEVPDLLAVSFSALDTVGHDYGPNSPEVLDVLLRLDKVLGELIETAEAMVGEENLLISLSSDHGVVPLPEVQQLHGLPGKRLGTEDIRCIQQAGRELQDRFEVPLWIEFSQTLDLGVVEEEGIDLPEVLREAETLLRRCPMVVDVWTATELEAPAPADLSEVERRYRNSYHPQRSPHLQVQLGEYDLGITGRDTTHGSVYSYDSHVPLILRRPGGSFGRIAEPVRTVDLAPTLARLLAVPIPEGLDGVSLADRLSAAEAPRVEPRVGE